MTTTVEQLQDLKREVERLKAALSEARGTLSHLRKSYPDGGEDAAKKLQTLEKERLEKKNKLAKLLQKYEENYRDKHSRWPEILENGIE